MPGMIVYLQYLIPQKLAGLTDNSNYCFYILAIHNGSAFIPPSVLNKTGFPFHDRNSFLLCQYCPDQLLLFHCIQ